MSLESLWGRLLEQPLNEISNQLGNRSQKMKRKKRLGLSGHKDVNAIACANLPLRRELRATDNTYESSTYK